MKSPSTPFQLHSRENGDVKTSSSTTATDVHKMDEFDIKILQQKRHEAEVKRSVTLCYLICQSINSYSPETKVLDFGSPKGATSLPD